MNINFAFDSSVREKDEDGHLRISRTVISAAKVDPYYGREIPGHDELGLEPDRIYSLLRCPLELESGAPSAKGKQFLVKHTPVNSTNPEKEITIGSVGSNVLFEDGKLYADLTVWDEEAISLIESGRMKELSSGYAYDPDMTSGEFEGVAYDGVMRNIRFNHVALVERGRIGPLAVISDSLPFEMRLTNMKLKKGAGQLIAARLRKIAQDGVSEEATEELVREVAENIEHKPAYDEDKLRELAGDNYELIKKLIGGEAVAEDEDKGPKAEEERKKLEETDRDDRDAKKAEDETPAPAMDADSIAAAAAAMVEAKYAARDAVEPLVGRIALDGFTDAKSIYAYALKAKGIACDGINEAGLRALVSMQRTAAPAAPVVAMDAAPSDLTKRFKRG